MKIRRRSRISIDLYDTHIIPAVREAKLQGKSTISVFELLVEGQTLTTEDLLRLSRFGTLYKTYIKKASIIAVIYPSAYYIFNLNVYDT